jgi:hypothetical protein
LSEPSGIVLSFPALPRVAALPDYPARQVSSGDYAPEAVMPPASEQRNLF